MTLNYLMEMKNSPSFLDVKLYFVPSSMYNRKTVILIIGPAAIYN